jgi:A/G-specific adenine glycosylase
MASYESFRRKVWTHWHLHGRHNLPWRKTTNPYRILVSEVMLQQTQVSRVLEKYQSFLHTFPTIRTLAKSPLVDVIRAWSGLGYNRRARHLREAVRTIMREHGGKVPRDKKALLSLPGVGPYTASAVRVFAFGEEDVLIETNIRTVYIHHFYSNVLENIRIEDADILPLARSAAAGQESKKWHWALMDYGVNVKKLYGNPARRADAYVRQSPFEGSLRQVRGAIVRTLTVKPQSAEALAKELTYPIERVEEALAALARDNLVFNQRTRWRIR